MTGRMPASSRALDTCWQHGGRALLSPVAGGKLRTAPGGLPRAVGPAEARPGSESWQFRSVSNVHLPLTPGRQADSSLTATTCRPFCFRAVGVLGPEDVTGGERSPCDRGPCGRGGGVAGAWTAELWLAAAPHCCLPSRTPLQRTNQTSSSGAMEGPLYTVREPEHTYPSTPVCPHLVLCGRCTRQRESCFVDGSVLPLTGKIPPFGGRTQSKNII